MRILITGASGFIGSFLVEKALDLGFEVWAGVRASSSRRYLQDERIKFLELDFNEESEMEKTFNEAKQTFGGWDVIIHAAGLTKSRWRHDFFATNYNGTRHLVNALRAADIAPKQFIYLSSLSIFGPIREKAVAPHIADTTFSAGDKGVELENLLYEPITEKDIPQPNTAYGMSKNAAEIFLRAMSDFPWVIFRPTGVYGPRERDYFLMAKNIKKHIDFAAGFKRQEITFIYVRDLVDAIFAAIEKGVTKRSYFVSDGRTYESRAFSLLLQKEMDIKKVFHITAPIWLLYIVCAAAEIKTSLFGGVSALNLDKYKIMKQRNWQCDISATIEELGFKPKYDLRRGVKETIAWYKEEKWI